MPNNNIENWRSCVCRMRCSLTSTHFPCLSSSIFSRSTETHNTLVACMHVWRDVWCFGHNEYAHCIMHSLSHRFFRFIRLFADGLYLLFCYACVSICPHINAICFQSVSLLLPCFCFSTSARILSVETERYPFACSVVSFGKQAGRQACKPDTQMKKLNNIHKAHTA